MDTLALLVFAAIVAAALVIYRKMASRQPNTRDPGLVERQQAIQAAIDALGLKLKDGSTTVQEGEEAMRATLATLHALDVHKDLPELIADTEGFFKDWRASRTSA
jgi:hypothetical protein